MAFAAALNEYLVDGLSEALAEADPLGDCPPRCPRGSHAATIGRCTALPSGRHTPSAESMDQIEPRLEHRRSAPNVSFRAESRRNS